MPTLKEFRESKGVKVKAVADYLGVTRQTYREWEKKQGHMGVDQARAVCEFLDAPFDEIFLPKKDGDTNKTNV